MVGPMDHDHLTVNEEIICAPSCLSLWGSTFLERGRGIAPSGVQTSVTIWLSCSGQGVAVLAIATVVAGQQNGDFGSKGQ